MNNSRNNTESMYNEYVDGVPMHKMNIVMLYSLSRKMIAGICLLIMISFQSCNPEKLMEGTYVNTAGSEFSIAQDTLIVELEQNNRYLIHRSTGFRLLDDSGKPGLLQHEKQEWTAVYDPRTQVMTESRNGKQISFDQDKQVMSVGKRKYKRILTE